MIPFIHMLINTRIPRGRKGEKREGTEGEEVGRE